MWCDGKYFSHLIFFIWVLLAPSAAADETSARAAMENPENPLVQIATAEGNIFIELLVTVRLACGAWVCVLA